MPSLRVRIVQCKRSAWNLFDFAEESNPELTTADPAAIFSAVTSPSGLTAFLRDHRYPEHMLVSCELVDWLIAHVREIDGVDAAVAFCQQMLDEKRIQHISGKSIPLTVSPIYHPDQKIAFQAKPTMILSTASTCTTSSRPPRKRFRRRPPWATRNCGSRRRSLMKNANRRAASTHCARRTSNLSSPRSARVVASGDK
jgi:hypothetical protein